MHKKTKKLLVGLSVLGIALVLSWFLKQTSILAGIEKNISSNWYHEHTSSKDVLIVAIDEKTLSPKENGGLGGMNTWSKETFRDLVENIEKDQPSSLFFDISLNPSQSLSTDELKEIATTHPNVTEFTTNVLSYLNPIHPADQAFITTLQKYTNIYLLKKYKVEKALDEESQTLIYESPELPSSIFNEVVKTAFGRLSASSTSNSSMIFAVPRYYQEEGSQTREQNINFQLAEHFLGQPIPEEEVPLEKGEMLINYAFKPYEVPSVSFADVALSKVEPSLFKNKIVLIGATAAILQDRHFTPIDTTVPMPGIEIHANTVQTLLDKTYLQNQTTGDFLLQTTLLLAAVVTLSLFAPLSFSGLGLALLLLLFPFYAQFRFDHGSVVNFLPPVLTLILAYIAVLVYRNFTEFAERRKLRDAFSHYVAPEVVHQISEHPELLALGGERRKITAFFLDIENFTHLSEGLSPQEVVKVINRYFDALSTVIMENGGTVDKFEGDAIMALFGAPVPSLDHAQKACQAALAIREKMQELNATEGRNLNVRIGLATGEAIVGNMGSKERFDYTAMGDTVNTASRLEGANKFYRTRILVTEETAKSAEGIFCRQVDTVCLKGKDQALKIYEVLGLTEGASSKGKIVVQTWETALAAYTAGHWTDAEKGMQEVLTQLPEDGPAQTLLARIAILKMNTPVSWDGVWRFEEK